MNGSNGCFVLGILLGLLCGGGLYHWIAGREAQTTAAESDALARRASPIAASDPGRDASADQLPDSEANGGRHNASQARVTTKELDSAEIRKLVADLDLAPANQAKGTGAIFGRVVDDSGAGLAGVTLRITAFATTTPPTSIANMGQAPPKLETLEDAVREAAKKFQASRSNSFESVTDGAGRYRVAGLPNREWRVDAYLAGYQVIPETRATEVQINSELNFTATRVVEFAVSVHKPDGNLTLSATLQCSPTDEPTRVTSYTWNSDETVARLTPGEYEITAFSSEASSTAKARQSSESKKVVVRADDMQPVRFDLRERLGIRGIAREASGVLKSESLYVWWMPLGPQQAVDLTALSKHRKNKRVQPGAEFMIPDLNPGRYLVGASHTYDSEILAHEIVEVSNGWVRCDLEVLSIDQAPHLRVTVIGPDGKSVSGVHFGLKITSVRASRTGGASNEKRDKEGAYWVALRAEDGKAYFDAPDSDVKFTLTASHAELGSREVELTHGQVEVRVEFDVPGTLTLTLAGYVGSGMEGRLEVSVNPRVKGMQHGGVLFGNGTHLSTEGVQEFTGLKAGPHVVEIKVRQRGALDTFVSQTLIERVEVDILPGSNALQISLPPLYSFRVHYDGGKKDLYIGLSSAEHADGSPVNWQNGTLDANGYVTFKDIRAGEYILDVRESLGGEGGHMRITVPCQDIEFEPKPVNAWRVYISDEGGDFYRVGLRSEDIVIGAAGKKFSEAPKMEMFGTTPSSTAADIVLMVERNGKQVAVTVHSGDIGDWNTMGGRLHRYSR